MQRTYIQPIWEAHQGKSMKSLFIKQFVDPGLGNSSYLVASKEAGLAVVIDPQRDVDKYLYTADELGLRLTHALETHLHEDFVSGSLELAALLGSTDSFQIGVSAKAGLQYEHLRLSEGDRIPLGDIFIRVIETPGHAPEHVSYVVYHNGSDVPVALFSGGALIVGGVGRSDLLGDGQRITQTRAQFHTLHDKLLKLPEEVVVYPTHGSGSFSITPASKERVTSIRQERRANPLAQADSEEEFVKRALMGASSYPTYYRHMRRVNRQKRAVSVDPMLLVPLDPVQVAKESERKAVIIDIRPARQFIEGHIPNSYGIPLMTPLVTWAGWVVPFGSPIILVADSYEEREEASRQLIRIGYDNLRGYLDGGLEAWEKAGLSVSRSRLVSPSRLLNWLAQDVETPILLDVRQHNEWAQGHIDGAWHIEAGSLSDLAHTIKWKDYPIVVHCARGNRSAIALSILEQKGFRDLSALEDGFSSWAHAGYEIVHGENNHVSHP